MLRSFSEFKFLQAFRVPVEEADEVRFLLEIENELGETSYIDDAKLVDISMIGIGFTTKQRLSVGEDLRVSIYFKRVHLDLEAQVIRSFASNVGKDGALLYGAEFQPEDLEDVKKFIEQYIISFSNDRVRDSVIQMALTDHYSNATEGLEMFGLLVSLFNDMTNFAEKEGFVDTVLEEITAILLAQRATVYLVNPDSNELEAFALFGGDKKDIKFDFRKGIAGSVFTTGLSINLDLAHDKNHYMKEMDSITGLKTKSIICNPIHNREDKVIGCVEVVNKNNEDRFSVEDEKIMKVVGLIFSSVFHNYNPISKQSAIRRFSAPSNREFILIGKSKHALAMRNSIIKLKDLDTSILFGGEQGTGKSLLAKIIHLEGKRGIRPHTEVFCGLKDATKLKIELFGEGGIPSKIDQAQNGTIYLKEIQALEFSDQEKLFTKLLEAKENNGLRIFVSSSKNLEKLMNEGHFYDKLYHLVTEAYIHLAPLRKREEDLRDLITHFLRVECKEQGFLLKSFAPSVMKTFLEYDWPGNIKELKTTVSRIVLYNPKNHVISSLGNLAMPIIEGAKSGGAKGFDEVPYANDPNIVLKDRLALIERQLILAEIKRNNGNKSKAAREMGISREALRKKLMLSEDILEALDGHKGKMVAEKALNSKEDVA